MDPDKDARLRMAARRHPANRVIGSLHYAQHQLDDVTRAFLGVMARAGNPGVQPFPPPAGRTRWPRNHRARHAHGWPVPVEVDEPFECWIDLAGVWWMMRLDPDGVIDAHPSGSPLTEASQLQDYADALEQLLVHYGL